MARESCNLDKDEAEILKPSSSPSPSPSPSSPPSLFLKPCEELPIGRSERPESPNSDKVVVVGCAPKHDKESEKPAKFGNRCSSCRKKVGLTGFRCRCGDLFCGHHRYSETHDCSFDYKAAGREEIARANPVIRAAKIIKI